MYPIGVLAFPSGWYSTAANSRVGLHPEQGLHVTQLHAVCPCVLATDSVLQSLCGRKDKSKALHQAFTNDKTTQ